MNTEESDPVASPLAPRQVEILDFIHRYMARETVAPTIREIGREFRISSTSVVAYHLRKLRLAGYLTDRPVYDSRSNVPSDAVVLRIGAPATVRTPDGEVVRGELVLEAVAA